jgi:hypothetical protein
MVITLGTMYFAIIISISKRDHVILHLLAITNIISQIVYNIIYISALNKKKTKKK